MSQDYAEKFTEAKNLVKELNNRVKEHKERPKAMEALKSSLNHTQFMIKSMRNYSKIGENEDGPFTDVELTTIETLHKGMRWR